MKTVSTVFPPPRRKIADARSNPKTLRHRKIRHGAARIIIVADDPTADFAQRLSQRSERMKIFLRPAFAAAAFLAFSNLRATAATADASAARVVYFHKPSPGAELVAHPAAQTKKAIAIDLSSLNGTNRMTVATQTVPAEIRRIRHRVDINTLERSAAPAQLAMNDIARVALVLAQPVFADRYADDRATGAFILIDEVTNHTVAAGMITATHERSDFDI